jgi:uncharacterized iron-regulated protein
MKKILIAITLFIVVAGFKNDKPAYRIFDNEGKKVKYEKMLDSMKNADVVFFGEQHNNPICHWLQFELTKDLYKQRNGNIILGAEMFEKDNQLILDEYLNGEISNSSFTKEARLWPNYKTDYQPLVEFAKDSNLRFIATNIPRRYASVVYKHGFEALDSLVPEAKSYIAPIPIEYDPEVACYKNMLQMGGGHGGENLPKAQAIKDATMAYSIAGYAGDGKLFIHFNGSYHSDDFEGILWYLNKYKPGLKVVTIASVEQTDLDELSEENMNKGNFVLVVDTDMTKTN